MWTVRASLGDQYRRPDLVDLASDYQDMAAGYQGLGYLESGITEPLNRFAEKMLDFSALLKHAVSRSFRLTQSSH